MAKKPLSILSSDILIADVMVPLEYKTKEELAEITDPAVRAKYKDIDTLDDKLLAERYKNVSKLLDKLLLKKNVKRGQKIALTAEEFRELSSAMDSVPTNGTTPGGSAANTLTTLIGLVGDNRLNVNFLGVAGKGMQTNIIRDALAKSRIRLFPNNPHPINGEGPESALSFVFTEPTGERTIATYPGNAKAFLTPDIVTPEKIHENDVLFVQGSIWEKFNKSLPDHMLKLRWEQNKEIWLALPTHAKFSDDMPPDRYRFLIPSADVLLGNDEELMRIYEKDNLDDALKAVQKALSQRDEIRAREGKPPRTKEPRALITCGPKGAAIVTPDKIEFVEKGFRDPNMKIYTLGAGDASFAGFLAGHVAGLSPKECTQLAQEVAASKLRYNSARMPNPRYALETNSVLGKELLRRMDAGLNATLSLPNGRSA